MHDMEETTRMEFEVMLTSREICLKYRISIPTLKRLEVQGLPFYRLGSGPKAQKRYPEQRCEAWFDQIRSRCSDQKVPA
jgi:hypothetical protein